MADTLPCSPVSTKTLAKIRRDFEDVNPKAAMKHTMHSWSRYKEDVQLAAGRFIIRGELSLDHAGLLARGDQSCRTPSEGRPVMPDS